MTQETFVKIIRSVIGSKGVHLSDSKASKLNALARQYGAGQTDVTQAIEMLKSIFADDFDLGRHEYAEMEKQLKRY